MAQIVKNLPAMQETWILSLGQEDPPEKGMVTHSSILAWRIPWIEESGGPQSMGSQRVRHNWVTHTHTHTHTHAHTYQDRRTDVTGMWSMIDTAKKNFPGSTKLLCG